MEDVLDALLQELSKKDSDLTRAEQAFVTLGLTPQEAKIAASPGQATGDQRRI